MPQKDPRPRYSQDQVSLYLDRLKIPQDKRHYDVSKLSPKDALKYMTLLQRHHLVEIPFENLTLHYSQHHQLSLHHEAMFQKVVGDNNGRGGYCMESNTLFLTLLLSLNYTVYAVGGRVNEGGEWTGLAHVVSLVTIGEIKYLVDVGFGGDGPVAPMALDKSETAYPHIGPASARIRWTNLEQNSDPNQRLWVFEQRWNDQHEWRLMYCFTELEYLPRDIVVMNYFTSTNSKSWFTTRIVVQKKTTDEQGELNGDVIVSGRSIKWRIQGDKVNEIEFASEEDRLQALEEHFGIKFGQAEKDGIRGLPSAIS